MEESESIDEYERRLRKIENDAIDLGEAIPNERLVSKVLLSFPAKFHMKICAIDEAKNTSTLGLDELMNSLRTYELEMNMEKKEKGKSIALQISNDSYKNFVDWSHDLNEADLGYDSIALITKNFGDYLKKMRETKKFRQKSKSLVTPSTERTLKICGPEQEKSSIKGQARPKTEGKVPTMPKKIDSVQCHECQGYDHYAYECANRLRKCMNITLSDDESEGDHESSEEEAHTTLTVMMQNKSSVAPSEVGEDKFSLENVQKMYEELYADWITRSKHNTALSKENSELKVVVDKLEVVLSRKDLELYKIKDELGKETATLVGSNSSKAKLELILLMRKDDKAGLGNWYFDSGSSRHMT
ncbi:uncharacterized protein [Henckelia pumila]|uniref:uncharacterized protein n=1 Tax=Henckelia pumila TaxID=405737 RepID=UPI003C6DB903